MTYEERYKQMFEDEIYPARHRKARVIRPDGQAESRAALLFLNKLKNLLPPVLAFIVFIGGWELVVQWIGTPKYLLPKPSDIVTAAYDNWDILLPSVFKTIKESIIGFVLSIVLGISGAVLLASSKIIEKSIYPYAVILQTVPIVAIAPIIVIWFGAGMNAIVIIAFLIGFFPMLSNTLIQAEFNGS